MSDKQMTMIIGALLLLVTGLLLTMPLNMSLKLKKQSSIVRLHTLSGRFFCSGVVISGTKILTAAHCVSDGTEPIEVKTAENKSLGVIGIPAAANPRSDVAIIFGDFTQFEADLIDTNANSIDTAFRSNIKSCGFPQGGKLTCFEMSDLGKYYFFYTSKDGGLWPGMSGGPVYNSDGKVIGVNSAVTEKENIFAPIVELEAMLGIRL